MTPRANANDITNRILVEIPKRFPARVWRRNVGGGYPISAVKSAMSLMRGGRTQEAIELLIRTRPVMFGLSGEPDIDGLVGPDGRRIGIEIKAGRDKQRPDQQVCQRVWESHGAVYLIARDVEQALADLGRALESK